MEMEFGELKSETSKTSVQEKIRFIEFIEYEKLMNC